MSKVENKKNILLVVDLSGGATWTSIINIPFLVDEIKVRAIVYNGDPMAREGYLKYIYSNLIPDENLLGICGDGLVNNSQESFLFNKQRINNTYEFKVLKIDGTLDNGLGDLM